MLARLSSRFAPAPASLVATGIATGLQATAGGSAKRSFRAPGVRPHGTSVRQGQNWFPAANAAEVYRLPLA